MSRVRSGSSRGGGGTGRASAPPTYPDTMSGYGPTRADSIGQGVSQYAYSSAQQSKAYNSKASGQSPMSSTKQAVSTPSMKEILGG